MKIKFNLNGRMVEVDVAPNTLLLDLLRDELRITSVKRGCEVGECGTCTVLIDGKPVNSCLILAPKIDGKTVLTVEGLAKDGKLHPLQEAFIEEFALQCGFCTPGILLSAKALLDINPRPTVDDIKEALLGNICRCGAYHQIITAILKVSQKFYEKTAGNPNHRNENPL